MSRHVDKLLSCLNSDNALEVTHHHGERVRTKNRAYTIDRVLIFLAIRIKRRVNRFLKSLKSVSYLNYVCAENLHSCNVGRLLFNIDGTHIDIALKPEISRRRRKSHAVLTGACLCDDLFLAHILSQKRLSHAMVELMCARMVKVLTLCVKLNLTAKRI